MHRDLKPENILFETKSVDSPIKIIDFGSAREFTPGVKISERYGAPYYIAPEILKKNYDEKCDIWSIGVITYIMLCGYPPFNARTDSQILKKVLEGKFTYPKEEWDNISVKAKNFINHLLAYNPIDRYSAQEALNDPWLTENITEVYNKEQVKNCLKNIQEFRAEGKLKQATWNFLVTYMSTAKEKLSLIEIFHQLDLNGDGKLTLDEL
jgi:calcium-dependent protein kinase